MVSFIFHLNQSHQFAKGNKMIAVATVAWQGIWEEQGSRQGGVRCVGRKHVISKSREEKVSEEGGEFQREDNDDACTVWGRE